MPRLYVNRVKPNPRQGQKFSVIQKGGQTYHKYGPGRVFKGGPRPKATPLKPIKPPAAARPAAPAVARPATPGVGPAPMIGGPPAPPDPRYENEIAGAARTRDTTIAGVGAARTQGLIDYGYTEGAGGALNFDPNNSFSKAAQLKRNYDASRRSSGNTMAAGGGLYSGAYQSAQDVVNRGELGAQDELQTSLAQFLSGNTADRAAAGTRYQEAAGEAESDRVGRIEDNPLYEPTVGYGSPVAPAGRAARPAARPAAGKLGGGRKAIASLGPKRQAVIKRAIKQGKPLPAGTLKGTNLTPAQKAAVRQRVQKKGKK